MPQYLVQFLLKSDIDVHQAEEFVQEVLHDVRTEHLFPSEAVQLVKISRKAKEEKIEKTSHGIVPEEGEKDESSS